MHRSRCDQMSWHACTAAAPPALPLLQAAWPPRENKWGRGLAAAAAAATYAVPRAETPVQNATAGGNPK